jgi:hypothetical protein
MSGTKADGEKPKWYLVSWKAVTGMVRVLTFGAIKYDERNWEKGIAYSRVFAALMRHLTAWWGGEKLDAESGMPHLDHAACCLHFLQHYQHGGYDAFDDRPKSAPQIVIREDVAIDKGNPSCRRCHGRGEITEQQLWPGIGWKTSNVYGYLESPKGIYPCPCRRNV